ncbi:MAG: DUF423 domain-containing protein [Sphingobacteriales bacterium]|nr:MAG: DUF423 domain-containing protein [Sphingobacteriales bacterium]
MKKSIVIWASIFGLIAVILGAFGAHNLKKIVSPNILSIWQTGIQYQFYHTFALLFLSNLSNIKPKYINFSFYGFVLGIILFSGSLYLLALKDFLGAPWLKYLGPITPIGGLFFILGWLGILCGAIKGDK